VVSADHAQKAMIARPPIASVKIVAYQNAPMCGEPSVKCPSVTRPSSEYAMRQAWAGG
jgi:hypothetical protein